MIFCCQNVNRKIDRHGVDRDDETNERKKNDLTVKLERMVKCCSSVPCSHFLPIFHMILFVFGIYCHQTSGPGIERKILKTFINVALEHFITAFRMGICRWVFGIWLRSIWFIIDIDEANEWQNGFVGRLIIQLCWPYTTHIEPIHIRLVHICHASTRAGQRNGHCIGRIFQLLRTE